jgi:hypothetical protein
MLLVVLVVFAATSSRLWLEPFQLVSQAMVYHPMPGVYGVGFGSAPLVGGSILNINSNDRFRLHTHEGAPSIPDSPD